MRAALLLAMCLTALLAMENKPTVSPASPPTEPTGALLAFTSNDPAIIRARQWIAEGRLSDAGSLLQNDRSSDARTREETLDLITRIRTAYPLSPASMLARLTDSIPGISDEDLERWRGAGQVQFRLIDGKVSYFGREPANLFRFCDEAKRRRRAARPEAAGWSLEQHLARVIAAAEQAASPEVVPIRHRVRYLLTVSESAPDWKRGALVRVWLPFPQEYRQQQGVKLVGSSSPYIRLAPSAAGENPLRGTPQRTIYFEKPVENPSKPLTFEATFEFTSAAYYPALDDRKARPLSATYADGHLGERPPHIVFTPELRATVAKIVAGETNPLARARRIFHFVAENIAYCAEEEYGTIPSLSTKGLSSRRGDCGVQTMVFITMCRCAGIPARWQSGWQTRRDNSDMHDWCEFYVEPWGWLPADPSYGRRDSTDPSIRDFYFGHQDSYRLIVNRDYGFPLDPPKLSPRSEPLDFQRGEVELNGHNLYFPYWNYDIEVEWLNKGP